MTRRTTLIPILLSIFFISCSEVRTSNPIESYRFWAGEDPTDDIEVLNGQYWQSAHWTKEYILYLKIKPTYTWWNEFVKQNHLQVDKEKWTKPADSPNWFLPGNKFEVYKPSDDFNDSRYFWNNSTGDCYFYEIQL